MDWLQSSLYGQHTSKDVEEYSFYKGYKSSKRSSDPNKSETPLLESPQCLEKEQTSDLSMDSSSSKPAEEKFSMLQNLSNKAGFLGCSKAGFKAKFQTDRQNSYSKTGNVKVTESKELLRQPENPKDSFSDDDSDDEWCMPRSKGYQKVRSGAY